MQPKFGSDSKWEFDILDMRVLHFEKLVPLHKEQSEKKEEKTLRRRAAFRLYKKGKAHKKPLENLKKTGIFPGSAALGITIKCHM